MGYRDRRQKSTRIGVQRVRKHLLASADLDDSPEIHHRDACRDMPNDRQIVRDEEVGEAELLAEIEHQVDDLGLDRDVE